MRRIERRRWRMLEATEASWEIRQSILKKEKWKLNRVHPPRVEIDDLTEKDKDKA